MRQKNFNLPPDSEWTILYPIEKEEGWAHGKWVMARCSCGRESAVIQSVLFRGLSKRCSWCARKLAANIRPRKFDEFKGREDVRKIRGIWGAMKDRCNNPNNKAYFNYGGRGIYVCNKWEESSLEFVKWSLNNGYEEGLSLDRIDNDDGYSESNCRWVNQTVQNVNSRTRIDNKTGERCITILNGKYNLQIRGERVGTYDSIDEAIAVRDRVYNDYFRDIEEYL